MSLPLSEEAQTVVTLLQEIINHERQNLRGRVMGQTVPETPFIRDLSDAISLIYTLDARVSAYKTQMEELAWRLEGLEK